MNRYPKIVERVAAGLGHRLRVDQILRTLRANGMSMSDFERSEPEIRGMVEVSSVVLPTGASLQRERRRGGASGYYLRVGPDVKDWSDVFWKHAKEAGGLEGGGYKTKSKGLI
jgi:3',5'-cyclic AMP phosphodiesterase CpdA